MTVDVERLKDRLASTPAVLRPATDASGGGMQLHAVVADLFRDRSTRRLEAAELAVFQSEVSSAAKRKHLELVAVTCWLVHDSAFQGADAGALHRLLSNRLALLADHVKPQLFIEDAERREELVRTCLAELGMLPAGETKEVAEDRLASLDSIRQSALLAAARAREQKRAERRAELDRVRKQEEEERRQAARTTFED